MKMKIKMWIITINNKVIYRKKIKIIMIIIKIIIMIVIKIIIMKLNNNK